MGQRLQVIAIAKDDIRAAFHHQWLYGHTAINVCADALKFAKQSPTESRGLGAFPTQQDFQEVLKVVLSVVRRGQNARAKRIENWIDVTKEGLCKDFTLGDNNDGVIILDLRDPKDPAYCFVTNNDLYSNPFTPISGEDYLATYYQDEDDKKTSSLKTLAKFRLINTEGLKKLFPQMSQSK